MTLDMDPNQQSIIDTFFEYIRAEDFEQGFHWARKALQSYNSSAFEITNQLEQQAKIDKEQLQSLPPAEVLLLFCACYSYARHEIEESNWYLHAETLVKSSITALETLPNSGLSKALCAFAAIQIDICYIDRGIYTSQDWLMAEAATNIANHLAHVSALTNSFNTTEHQLYAKYLVPEFAAYQHFNDGISIIAELYAIRWGEPTLLTAKMTQLRPKFIQAVNALTADDKYIMSTDLEALWPPLTFFSENRQKASGELIVERGMISISYFANINHLVTRELRQTLKDIVANAPAKHPLYLSDWAAETPQSNMLNDIWAGIARDFEDIYSWQLPELSLPFRNKTDSGQRLTFDVELIYYPMGIFALNLKAPLDNVTASGVRHAMSLGTPFAMDQDMRWHDQQVGLLEDFAKHRFSELGDILNRFFDHYKEEVDDLIIFNTSENRFVSTMLDRVAERIGDKHQAMTAKSLKSHFAYPAFVLPQRELRSAVDDWCLRSVTHEQHNLNRDCYNHDEFVFTNHHECVLGLLQQPNWVLEQSSEMMEVAAAVNNLFHLTNKLLDKQLRINLEQAVPKLKSKNASAAKLRAQVKKLTDEGECLKQFTIDAHWLLDLINAGSMMTFPDHTRMIQKVFHYMDFEKLHTRTQDTLDKIQHRQQEIINETGKLYEKIRTRNSKRFTRVLSGSMALISIGALKDIFDILNGSKMGFEISGPLQVSIVTFFGMLLVILLINKNEGDK
ncbi:hypothetical protein L2747_12690 [Shewanella marinintestina]|uniref:hypothetical protein n=1 Tax=Shewanella marinintestina TaxID=190305 RepID=UPI00200F7BF9|nr:hypothetical protein [Shewanella marinintestina]MCL1146856.1 hypothetical protein [Shewanella marinintestina]